MRYTYQCVSDSFSFANPTPEEVLRSSSLDYLKKALKVWAREHEKMGTDPSMASIWVCKGSHKSIEYPDFILKLGPRGGVKKETA